MRGQTDDVDLEQRAYGPHSTPEECDAIADRVSRIEECVLLMREMPVQSPFSINVSLRLTSESTGRSVAILYSRPVSPKTSLILRAVRLT